MIDLLLVALGLVAVLVTLSFFLNWYAHFWYKTLVADQMELINAIVLTEEVPKAWRVPVLDPAARRGETPFWRKVRALLYLGYVRRLDRLIHSLQTSSYLSKDEKAEFIEAFAQIRTDWQELAK